MQVVVMGKAYTVSIKRVEHKALRDAYTVYTMQNDDDFYSWHLHCFDSGKRAYLRNDGFSTSYCDHKNDQQYIKALQSLIK